MIEDPLGDGGVLDAGDHPQPAAATPAGLDLDGTLSSVHSGHMVNTLSGVNGLGPGSTRSSSLSK
jgi:hypothetical protein